MNSLLSLLFWFDLTPVSFSPVFEKLFFFLFAFFILLASVSKIIARQKKGDRFTVSSYKRLSTMFTTLGILGMLWFFFSFEEVYFFGARFWFLLWLAGFIVWVGFLYRYMTVIIPAKKMRGEAKAQENKYLPRRNGS